MRSFEDIMVKAQQGDKKTLVVAAAHDEVVIKAIVESVKLNVINAILVGNEEKILEICKKENLELNNIEIINEKDNVECAKMAVKLVSSGKADFIMKGMLNTSDILRQVLNKEYGLRKEKVLSHTMLYSVSTYHKLLFLTDGGMILNPTLEEKISIINNAVFLANKLGIEKPKVAVLAAVENVNVAMENTLDAASLTVMCKRNQIKNCIIDGPLALDNAISIEAAKHKGITSEVAGDADILLVPNIEVGNALGKALSYFAKAENAGVIMGAKCPIVLVSRADSEKSKIYSIALGSLLC
ncbi:phosphate butyryltransferase [Clostridium collagenovorans DSM 3089]|uniref:Phosphate butyryltransferase n=1 Tax=Clostridium collagenovorans DSM 3089 TaxID=1121306 RepID=A0A1M5VR97_9CLOT|nr:bifunctional enoyl-CoA hydratase/phosphate acetyltransferase [Clostridium collagenovorans]SHH77747.1 phosphate butyryltransferase [Clostridium collagenovorans DSM 3089]